MTPQMMALAVKLTELMPFGNQSPDAETRGYFNGLKAALWQILVVDGGGAEDAVDKMVKEGHARYWAAREKWEPKETTCTRCGKHVTRDLYRIYRDDDGNPFCTDGRDMHRPKPEEGNNDRD